MPLAEYRKKRDFQKTPEPSGATAGEESTGQARFVIQKHAATRLHYDLRLEAEGVLKSWAVPKGPSLDPGQKRLAVEVEDHPLDYGTFEGLIPQGEYGGGTVIVWDRGVWKLTNTTRYEQAYRAGKIEFELQGEKLHGNWVLVRTHGSAGGSSKKPNWLLIKRNDSFARHDASEIVDEQVQSVASGRTLEEVAAGKAARATGRNQRKPSTRGSSTRKVKALPKTVEPQLATLAETPPEGDAWGHEIKLDGYRMLCYCEGGKVRLMSRNGLDWSAKFPALIAELARLPVESALLDGEVVMLDEQGVSHFQALQEALSTRKTDRAEYFVFDLLHLDGESLLGQPLDTRKQRLAELLQHASVGKTRVRLSEHIVGGGAEFFEEACKLGLEGIISKRLDAPYRSGRGRDWLKIKGLQQEPFVIGGYTRPTGRRSGLGALLLGHFDSEGQLLYAGKVGTGFDEKTLAALKKSMTPLEVKTSPFSDRAAGVARGVTWIRPKLVCQVGFAGWTRERLLRQARFLGLRADRKPVELKKDDPENRTMRPSKPARVALPENTRLTSPERVMYPKAGVTKHDLAIYYTSIADWILPHLAGRPLSLVRCPSGLAGPRFFQRHAAAGMPDSIRRIEVPGEDEPYVLVDDLPGLLALVQFSALELHVWGSRSDRIDRPDRLVFDLDPGEGVAWERVTHAAREVRSRLADLGLESWVKTTGGKGLHVVLPIDRTLDWPTAKEFTKSLAAAMVADSPERYVMKVAKAARTGKILIDYLRNDQGSTSVVAYSTRARDEATVSVPITWEEMPKTLPDQFRVGNLLDRLSSLKVDPWKKLLTTKQKITVAIRRQVAR